MKRKCFEYVTELPSKFWDFTQSKQNLGKLAILDVETTGLDPCGSDEIIDLAFAVIEYDRDDGLLGDVLIKYQQLREPSNPLSPDITQITGYKDKDLRGEEIVWDEVSNHLSDIDFIIAHNATFDRTFCEKEVPGIFRNKIWADTMTEIDWFKLFGVTTHSQELLALKVGNFVYDAHTAMADVTALAHLLNVEVVAQSEAKTLLWHLLQSVRKTKYLVQAIGAPYSANKDLKQAGYRWDTNNRCWYKTVTEDELNAEGDRIRMLGGYPEPKKIAHVDRFRKPC